MAIYTAGDVMNQAAVLLNDAHQDIYNYTIQMPYLKMVMRDIEQELNLQGAGLNFISEDITNVPAGDVNLSLPADFFMPISLMEKAAADTFYQPMKQVRDVNALQLQPTTYLGNWDFRFNSINFIGATQAISVQLSYYRLIVEIIDEDSLEQVVSAQNLLAYRTAGMLAQYVGNNQERAMMLNADAATALDRLLSITAKTNQGLRVRRKPFRRGYGRPLLGVPYQG